MFLGAEARASAPKAPRRNPAVKGPAVFHGRSTAESLRLPKIDLSHRSLTPSFSRLGRPLERAFPALKSSSL